MAVFKDSLKKRVLVYDELFEKPTVVDGKPVIVDRPDSEIKERYIAAVKEEASKRITTRFPLYKQINMNARGAELLKNKIINGFWTPEEEAEQFMLQMAFDWVKQVRLASNQLEAQTPKRDYTDDKYWPTY